MSYIIATVISIPAMIGRFVVVRIVEEEQDERTYSNS